MTYIEYDDALNAAGWVLLEEIQKYQNVDPLLFNHLKQCLKLAIEKYIEAGEKKTMKRGDRVKVNETSGFNKGAVGTVEFVEPNGKQIWVLRDGSSSPCFFHPNELDHIK
jgi:hypothetical protein